MRSSRAVLVAFAAALFAVAGARGQEKKDEPKKDEAPAGENPLDLASLETLVLKVETEGTVDGARLRDDLSIAFLKELPKPQGLVFPFPNDMKAETAFTQKYYEQYAQVFDAAAKRARDVAKENGVFKDAVKGDDGVLFLKAYLKKFGVARAPKTKKDAATNEVRALLIRMYDRYEKVRERQKTFQDRKALDKELAARVEGGKEFLKRYDFGPQVAKQHQDGASKLCFDLTKDVYELVKRNLGMLNAHPLQDGQGKDMKWRGKPLMGALASKLTIGDGNKSLEKYLGDDEYFQIQYAENERGDPYERLEEKALVRVTGAKLLLGKYFVVEAYDRVVVYLPDPPG
jgi:hypothetical protein